MSSQQSRWKKYFYRDVKTKLEYAEKEYQLYKKTGRTIHLQQACGKIFSAVENYLMVKYKRRQRSYKSLLYMVMNDKRDRTLLQQARQLHIFYYNGPLDIRLYEAEILYRDVRDKLKNRLRN